MTPTDKPRPSERVHRTQQALRESLLALIVEKGYERTTVEDVLRRADVGRTAFYTHFENKQDLLLHRFAEIPWCRGGAGEPNDGKLSEGRQNEGRQNEGQRGEDARGLVDVTFLFEHIAEQRELVSALRGTSAYEEVEVSLRANLLESFTQLLKHRSTHSGIERDVQLTALALTGALMQLLTWWIEAGMPETPATMASWFAQMGQRMVDA